MIGLLTTIALVGCAGEPAECARGDAAARSGRYTDAVPLLTTCLAAPSLANDQRRSALEVRAWSYARVEEPSKAVADQEEAFRLGPATEYRELMNFASYLRAAGRLEESLAAIMKAEKLGRAEPSMMTQYNLGWTLYELGRHEEAVAAFTKGVPLQPDYAFVYWRRGLAYERLGRGDEAREDFRRLSALLKKLTLEGEAKKLMPEIQAKLAAYGLR